MKMFELRHKPVAKPLDEWKSVAVELLGTQTRIIQGARWRHRVIEAGAGQEGAEPLILIHGTGGHAETFARNLRNLAAHGFHVLAIDALFHGYSSHEPWDYDRSLDLQTEALADLVRTLGYGYAHVLGESLGASIAFEFGLRYPELSGKLVLSTGFGQVNFTKKEFRYQEGADSDFQKLSEESILNPTFDLIRRRMEWLVVDPASLTDEIVDIRVRLYSDPEIHQAMKRVYNIGGKLDWPPRYEEDVVAGFKPETLVFWTDHNPGYGPDFGEYCASLLPDGSFYLMEGAGHWPQWEKPEEHDQVLIEFIKGPQA